MFNTMYCPSAVGWIIVLLSVCVWSPGTQSQCTFTPQNNYKLCMSVNGMRVANGGTKHLVNPGDPLTIECEYDVTLRPNPPSLQMILNDGMPTIVASRPSSNSDVLSYSVPREYRKQSIGFQCFVDDENLVRITVSYEPPTGPPSTGPPSTGSNFTGLNPLIYTISAVILLGSLAIVAIITCWIRARRSFNNRSLRSAQTAQDYFDYLSDNEFTPLTSEEFQASLQERPPTYTQSEQIESGENRTEEEVTPPQPEPEPTVSPEEAAIIENLIALNLLPEDSRPPPRNRRGRAPARPAPPTPQPPIPPTPPPPEEVEGREALEHLRSVGSQAQRLLAEQRSTGQLISLDTTEEQGVEPTVPTGHMTQAQSQDWNF